MVEEDIVWPAVQQKSELRVRAVPLLHVQLSLPSDTITLAALVDSGAEVNIMDPKLVCQLEVG